MAAADSIPAFIVAGTHSGCGKTTVSLGLMAALGRRGLAVQPYKCGPDFIDPTLHREVCGRPSRNLDRWMCGDQWTRDTFHRHLDGAGVAVVEGVMGMFDGGDGSAAALARLLGIPVLLVVDVRSSAESVAAVVKGFCELDPAVCVAGVICNRVGSARHRQMVADAVGRWCRVPVLGSLPRNDEMVMASRHLGLHLGPEQNLGRERLARLAALIEENLDLDGILARCRVRPQTAPPLVNDEDTLPQGRIAVARDEAFCFYYQDNLDILAAAGAEIVFFSPLADRNLPTGVNAVYLGGGYPELYADGLAANRPMLESLRKWCAGGGLCYAECGGFMYLCEEIEDNKGERHRMAGVFPVRAMMGRDRRALGYREVTIARPWGFGPAGTRLRGHEFHYSGITPMPAAVERLYRLAGGGEEGYLQGNTLGGYVHLHFGSNPEAAMRMAGTK